MEELSLRQVDSRRPLPPSLRDIMAIGFRHRRLMVLTFLVTFFGVLVGIWIVGSRYEAQMKILVKHERVDPVITAQATTLGAPQQAVSEEEMNSEVELIRSQDLLEQAVVSCGLAKAKDPFWVKWFSGLETPDALRITEAVRTLRDDLKVDPVKKSDLIRVAYASPDPELSARILNTIGQLYLAKHLAVNRPAGEFDFFQQQADQYQKRLAKAEARLGEFAGEKGAASATADRDIALQKVNELELSVGQMQSQIAATKQRIHALNGLLASTLPRIDAQIRTSDNAALLEQMKSTLLTLELKRTDLLSKFAPTYPSVREVETEIAQTRAAIQTAEKTPLREGTTDQNPVYQWLASELARAKAELPTLEANAATTEKLVRSYREKIIALGRKGLEERDLLRQAKTEEENYLLYQKKKEEARISDALDKKRISNVVIAETATVPLLPTTSTPLLVLLGAMLATLASAGTAFAFDFLDPSFRTPDEVLEYLDIPVLATMPENAARPLTALPPATE